MKNIKQYLYKLVQQNMQKFAQTPITINYWQKTTSILSLSIVSVMLVAVGLEFNLDIIGFLIPILSFEKRPVINIILTLFTLKCTLIFILITIIFLNVWLPKIDYYTDIIDEDSNSMIDDVHPGFFIDLKNRFKLKILKMIKLNKTHRRVQVKYLIGPHTYLLILLYIWNVWLDLEFYQQFFLFVFLVRVPRVGFEISRSVSFKMKRWPRYLQTGLNTILYLTGNIYSHFSAAYIVLGKVLLRKARKQLDEAEKLILLIFLKLNLTVLYESTIHDIPKILRDFKIVQWAFLWYQIHSPFYLQYVFYRIVYFMEMIRRSIVVLWRGYGREKDRYAMFVFAEGGTWEGVILEYKWYAYYWIGFVQKLRQESFIWLKFIRSWWVHYKWMNRDIMGWVLFTVLVSKYITIPLFLDLILWIYDTWIRFTEGIPEVWRYPFKFYVYWELLVYISRKRKRRKSSIHKYWINPDWWTYFEAWSLRTSEFEDQLYADYTQVNLYDISQASRENYFIFMRFYMHWLDSEIKRTEYVASLKEPISRERNAKYLKRRGHFRILRRIRTDSEWGYVRNYKEKPFKWNKPLSWKRVREGWKSSELLTYVEILKKGSPGKIDRHLLKYLIWYDGLFIDNYEKPFEQIFNEREKYAWLDIDFSDKFYAYMFKLWKDKPKHYEILRSKERLGKYAYLWRDLVGRENFKKK